MNIRSQSSVFAFIGLALSLLSNARGQVQCWGPGMSAPVTLTETNRSEYVFVGKPFRCDIYGVAGKLELGSRANNATLVNGVFKEKILGGLLGNGPTVQSASYVVLQTGLTKVYPEKISVSNSAPGTSVGPIQQYGQDWTLSDPKNRVNVNYGFYLAGSSLLGSLLPGVASPANYNLNPKGYFYALGEYHETAPVLTGTLAVSSDQIISGASVNVSYQISRYDAPIYRPPFLGLDLADVGLTILGSPPQTSAANAPVGAAPVIATGKSSDLRVTINLANNQGQGWLKISSAP